MRGAKRPAAILVDRDGTLIEEGLEPIASAAELRLLPGAARALGRLSAAGLPISVVSNQAGIGRGRITRADLDAIHRALERELASAGVRLHSIHFCPHRPEDGCDCRKPRPGLLLAAAAAHGLAPADCLMIGNRLSDIEAAARAGCPAVLVRTGRCETADQIAAAPFPPRLVTQDLAAAVAAVLALEDPPVNSEIASIEEQLRASAAVKLALIDQREHLAAVAAELRRRLDAGGTLYILGNGGSAADAQHMAAELVSGCFAQPRGRGRRAVALTTDSSALTALSNDFAYAEVFERQVLALARPADAVLGISTSGNSENVARALAAARRLGAHAIALTGASSGRVGEAADVTIAVPSRDTQRIQEAHIAIVHILCQLVA